MSQTRSIPPLDPDSSQAVLTQIAQEVESGSLDIDNEADTRLKVIDRILTDVLRWPLAQIKPETHTTSGYADYLLISPEGRALCVVEAKREGAVLVDTVASTRLVCGFDSRFIRPAQDGISQAKAYASSTGSTFAILTNGRSWLFYRPVRSDGLAPQRGKIIVYPTFQTIFDNFAEFYELAAYSSVQAKLYALRLSKAEGAATPAAEPRNYVVRPDQIKMSKKEALLNDLSRVYNEFFGTITDKADRQLLIDCFVESQESREADLALEKITSNLVEYVETLSSETADRLNRGDRDRNRSLARRGRSHRREQGCW